MTTSDPLLRASAPGGITFVEALELRAAALLARARARVFPSGRRGQTSIEYLLLLAGVVAAVIIFIAMFGKKFLGGFFTIIGMIVGQPSKK